MNLDNMVWPTDSGSGASDSEDNGPYSGALTQGWLQAWAGTCLSYPSQPAVFTEHL